MSDASPFSAMVERVIGQLGRLPVDHPVMAAKILIAALGSVLDAPDYVDAAVAAMCMDDLDRGPEHIALREQTLVWIRKSLADIEAVQAEAKGDEEELEP